MLRAGAFEGDPARGRLKLNGLGTVAGPGDFAGERDRSLGACAGVVGGAEKTEGGCPFVAGALKMLDDRLGTVEVREELGALKTLGAREGWSVLSVVGSVDRLSALKALDESALGTLRILDESEGVDALKALP